MKSLCTLTKKETLLGIGLMSGTSADGMDAALVEISGSGVGTKVKQKGFVSIPYANEIREAILRLATGVSGGSKELSLFHFLLGQLSLEACKEVCRQSGVGTSEVDFVGSHGQTLYHIPVATPYLGHMVSATLQLGEPSVICEGMDCVVVSDFRVRDMAAGGCGAPLVPYTEFLLYRSNDETVGLQNIGGIGNITVLPRAGSLEDTYAFDTGPGNMVMDALVQIITNGERFFDDGGYIAAKGAVNEELLSFMLQDPYLSRKPPKTTGREDYGADYIARLVAFGEEHIISLIDMLATATRFTAECVRIGIDQLCNPKPDKLIIGGGGSKNRTLLNAFRDTLTIPVLTNEDLGMDSDAKEAIAFAILANECLHGLCNNVPNATGAKHPVIMGKVSI